MPAWNETVSEPDFIALVAEHGPSATARRLNIGVRRVFARIKGIEERTGRAVPRPVKMTPDPVEIPGRLSIEVQDGVVVVANDAHYWPGEISTAHRAFVKFIDTYKPKGVVMNGDVFDGASISRHAPIAWETRPSVIQELETCQARLGEIEKAAGKALKLWPLGNHDARFESRLAHVAPEYARVHGVHLADHFPLWEKCWSVFVNGSTVIKHRYKGGIHAGFNNTKDAGLSIVTGHLHKGVVTPFTDYTGTRYGVDSPTLADTYGPQFTAYMEDNSRNWRAGFVVLTFANYELLQPEMALVVRPNVVDFRGRLWDV